MCPCLLSHFIRVQFCATLKTTTCQASLSMRVSRQNAGVHCHALLQGIFLTKNGTCIFYVQQYRHVGSLPLAPPGKPIINEFYVKTEKQEKLCNSFQEVKIIRGFPRWCSGKESVCKCRRHRRHRLDPWVRKIPWEQENETHEVFLSGKPHGQRSLVGYRSQG